MKHPKKMPPARQKRLMLLLAALALVLILLAGWLIWTLLSSLSAPAREQGELEPYLAEHWTVFQLRSWDPDSGALELDYPLRFSYEQMEKYGARLEELQALPAGNLETVAALKTAAFESVGVRIKAVTLRGVSSDGQIAYTVSPDGSVAACWDP